MYASFWKYILIKCSKGKLNVNENNHNSAIIIKDHNLRVKKWKIIEFFKWHLCEIISTLSEVIKYKTIFFISLTFT